MAHLTIAEQTAAWNYNVEQARRVGRDMASSFTGTYYPTGEEAREEAGRLYASAGDRQNLSDISDRAFADGLISYAKEYDILAQRIEDLGL